jgi:MFS family permease
VGSLLAPSLRRLLGGSTRWTCAALAVLGAGGLAGFGGTSVIPLAAGALTGYYVAHAGQWPLLSAVLHTRVTAARRATAVSAMSLAMTLGGTLGNLVVPRLAEAFGLQQAFLAVAALVLLSALLCLRLPRCSGDEEALRDQPLDDGEHLLGGLLVGNAGAAGQHGEQLPEPPRPVAPGEQGRAVDVDPA